MSSYSVAVTSAETGPGVMAQISAITSAILRPDLAMRLGLVVTPSTRPASARDRISDTSAVSTKNFMGGGPFNITRNGCPEGPPLRLCSGLG
jgi:hypothetical protein